MEISEFGVFMNSLKCSSDNAGGSLIKIESGEWLNSIPVDSIIS